MDIIVSCAVMAIVAAVTLPAVQAARDRAEARLAARYLAQRLQMMRMQAVRRNRTVAMRFDPADVGRFQAYLDGDGDGVLQRDIDSGVDISFEAPARLTDYFANVTLRVAARIPAPDGAGWLAAGADPVRIGGTRLLSFNALGNATSGTIYLASRGGLQLCVRILGSTGRVRVMWFDVASGAWRQD
jgi:type II secretory pathway pseudopilin PulG